MINAVHIENFRCLKFVEVDLRPLTVLIGLNDTGKTTFLDALGKFAGPKPSFTETDYWIWDKRQPIVINAITPDGPVTVRSDLSTVEAAFDAARKLHFVPTGYYQLPSTGVPMECVGFDKNEAHLPLGRSGERVAALLDYILRSDRKQFDAIVSEMTRLVPGLKEIVIDTPTPQLRRVIFAINNELRLPGATASTGVQTLLFFVTCAFHPNPPKLTLVEEPENGIHPRRLADVVSLLRDISTGARNGQPSQVVLTTHSPHLLDYIDIDRDEVLVCRRNEDGSRTIEPADQSRLGVFLDEFKLGEVWDNEREEGMIATK